MEWVEEIIGIKLLCMYVCKSSRSSLKYGTCLKLLYSQPIIHNNFHNPTQPTMKFHSTAPQLPKFKPILETTIAQLNKVSLKQSKRQYNAHYPIRIKLPEYFNIPAFRDRRLQFVREGQVKVSIVNGEDAVFRKRMKDLSVLAQGMKRSKNIKQQSRYYFTQGILLHNIGQPLKSIEYFQKFLKIVLYLQDLKSVELAFNAIGCAYMVVGEFTKALEFHARQGLVSERADRWVSGANRGLCEELLGNAKEAYSLYQQAEQEIELQSEQESAGQEIEQRSQVLQELIQRVQTKIRDGELFMTQNRNSPRSPNKSIENSLLKQETSLMLKQASNRQQYEKSKLKYAIHAAEQNLDQHLRSSIKYQSPR